MIHNVANASYVENCILKVRILKDVIPYQDASKTEGMFFFPMEMKILKAKATESSHGDCRNLIGREVTYTLKSNKMDTNDKKWRLKKNSTINIIYSFTHGLAPGGPIEYKSFYFIE